jgi:hypothetical protein
MQAAGGGMETSMRAALRYEDHQRLDRKGPRGAPAEGQSSYAARIAFIMGTATLLWAMIIGLSLALR